jgi:RHS repeat-associated protein
LASPSSSRFAFLGSGALSLVLSLDEQRKNIKITTPAEGTGTLTEYIGNIVYVGGAMSYILSDEGRIIADGAGADRKFLYEYNLKDHLGNNRVTFIGNNSGGSVDVVQTTSYYPFGLVMSQTNGTTSSSSRKNKYLYNGKELQDDVFAGSSLNWFDYGARFYDPQIGRWNVIDPSAETYSSWTPFNYCANNPINLIDLDGMDWYETENKKGIKWFKGSADVEGYIRKEGTFTVPSQVDNKINLTYDATQYNPVALIEKVLDKGDWETQRAKDGEAHDENGNKAGDEGDCYYQSGKMVKKSGATPSDNNAAGDFVKYIDSQIDKGHAVRVHVDRAGEKGISTGEHFVSISSRNTNLVNKHISYGFFDSGTGDISKGTNNTFNLNSNNTLTGNTKYSGKSYTVVKVKQNVK